MKRLLNKQMLSNETRKTLVEKLNYFANALNEYEYDTIDNDYIYQSIEDITYVLMNKIYSK